MGSSQLKVIVRADASIQIGMGHRVRCEVLASALRLRAAHVTFVVHRSCSAFAGSEDYVIDDEEQWHELASEADLIVLDHYGYDAAAVQCLYRLNPNLLVLDDNNNRGELHCRWLLNPLQLTYPDTVKYPLVGGQFALLRPQFTEQCIPRFQKRQKLLLTLGGTDPLELTLPFINSLFKKGFPSKNILAMVGSGVPNAKEIQHLCRQHTVDCHIGVSHVARLMAQSRYAISAAGGTLFELACMGVPTHFIKVADNQSDALTEHISVGWCEATDMVGLSRRQRVERIETVVDQVMQKWLENGQCCSELAQQCVDGFGAQRVVDLVYETYIARH